MFQVYFIGLQIHLSLLSHPRAFVHMPFDIIKSLLPSFLSSVYSSRINLNSSSFLEQLVTSTAHHCLVLCWSSIICVPKRHSRTKEDGMLYWNTRACFLLSIKENLVREGS